MRLGIAVWNFMEPGARLTIDTTGRSLHRRGYRTSISAAPLKETLAAALVMLKSGEEYRDKGSHRHPHRFPGPGRSMAQRQARKTDGGVHQRA